MAVKQRRTAVRKQPGPEAQQPTTRNKDIAQSPYQKLATASLLGDSPRRNLLAGMALLAALLSAASEWPTYMVYEQDWRKPAVGFTVNLAITAVLALAVGMSPPMRALKPGAPAAQPSTEAAAAAAAAIGDASRRQQQQQQHPVLARQAKRQLAAAFLLILPALYSGFGWFGPSGALTAACMCAFTFLALP